MAVTRLPGGQDAILDLGKLADYCLNPDHARGRHKARVFREALGIDRRDAAVARGIAYRGTRGGCHGTPQRHIWEQVAGRCAGEATGEKCCDTNGVDRSIRRERTAICNLLGAVMPDRKEGVGLLDVVALLSDLRDEGLARGQVGTVVELLDGSTALVEFSDDQGRAYAIVSCPRSELLVLRYVPEAA